MTAREGDSRPAEGRLSRLLPPGAQSFTSSVVRRRLDHRGDRRHQTAASTCPDAPTERVRAEMTHQPAYASTTPPVRSEPDARQRIRKALADSGRRIAVLDDDTTG